MSSQNGGDTINGDWQDNDLTGTEGDDSISGSTGNDTLDGGGGDDTLHGGDGSDGLTGGEGNDSLDGGSQTDTLDGGAGNDTLYGQSENDVVIGGDGDDYLDGGAQDDSLYGGAGNDTLVGGTDSDLMDGGAGDDMIYAGGYEGGHDMIVWGADGGHDTISGFSPEDDVIYVDGATIDDVVLTATDDPKIWVMTLEGVDDASLTIDFTYFWNSGITVEELKQQVVTEKDVTIPDSPAAAPVCLTAGTMVDTATGPRPVETLAEGDLLRVADGGLRPVRAVLRNRVSVAAQQADPALRPVEVAAGAFGDGLPRRRMLVSLQHAFLALDDRPNGKGEVLVRARHLAEELGLARLVAMPRANVTYYHLVMDRHELINADGVWTETVFAGPEALAADAVLQRMLEGRDIRPMDHRARPLLLRKHLRRFAGLRIGRGATEKDAAA